MVVEGSRKAESMQVRKQGSIPNLRNATSLDEVSNLTHLLENIGLSTRITIQANGSPSTSMSTQRDLPHGEQREKKCKCSDAKVRVIDGLSERVLVTLIVLGRMLQGNLASEKLATDFLIHTSIMTCIPLSKRSQALHGHDGKLQTETSQFLFDFSRIATMLLSERSWAEVIEANSVPCDIADLVDGRLFVTVSLTPHEIVSSSRSAILSVFEVLAHSFCIISGTHLRFPTEVSVKEIVRQSESVSTVTETAILPFNNPVFDKHLSSIHLRVTTSDASGKLSARIYQEVSHWHNSKRRLDPKQSQVTPASEKDKLRALKRNQFFMAEMQAYAASLTNAAGKALEPEVVTASGVNYPGSNKENTENNVIGEKSQNPKGQSDRKSANKKAMYEDIAAKKAIKDSEKDEKVFSAWKTVRKNLDSERQLQSKYSKIKAYLRDLPNAKRQVLQAEIEFHLLCILYDIYRGLCKSSSERVGAVTSEELFGLAALVWDTSRRLALMNGITKTIAERQILIIKALGLPDLQITIPTADRKLAYDAQVVLPKADELKVGMREENFQLLHCGPYMDRNLDSAPDTRVPFVPDGWQRRVLDELDAENSVFVVAPTSAGKTFISFYAMEKILRGNDHGVLVYVAPTKALVNQIAAEIQARFKKSYKHGGKSVWAIHTRDYRINNPSGCQILVTVPHILQIMLLAPSNAKSWSPRVKYIIFDEIHSIGQAEDGVVWEQLLLLAPCPIIALSATVGNPEVFNSWLSSTQQSNGQKVTMIKHQHRYSDLRKFVYTPPRRWVFQGLADRSSFATLGLDGVEGLSFIHPVSSLVNKSRGLPDDLSLEARDCLTLYEAMSKHATAQYPVDASLRVPNPSGISNSFRKADVIEWERELKTLLRLWMADSSSPFDAVLEDLSQPFRNAAPADQEVSKGDFPKNANDLKEINSHDLYATTLPLLGKLHQRDALPAIFFNYDRHRCENIAKHILKQLEEAEETFKNGSPTWKAKLAGFEKWKADRDKMAGKKLAKHSAKKKGKGDDNDDPTSKAEKEQDLASEDANPFSNFDPAAPVDGFHFAARQHQDDSQMSQHFSQMQRRGVAPWLLIALRRGIGVHHAGMNRKYRQFVEMYFRKGYLRVVIATGTLALGINMPCATVVFSGDSIFLTALNFRQAAGRAGRRGFDLLGNVVFQGISHGKICRLLSSRLPDLNGHFPITTTLVLRLFSLLQESGESPYAVRAINSLLSQARLYLDGEAFKHQVLHHLRFSIEYLRRQSLLSPRGTPINFAGLTSHLYFTENSSFALNALIKNGYFHELCAEVDSKESHVLRTLMVVMSHLFGRRPCRLACSLL